MKKNIPAHLTNKQFDVLRLLFQFRFGTSDLMAAVQGGISSRSMRVRLAWLEEKGFIAKKHDGRAKLEGKPAIYTLATKGRVVLRETDSKKYTGKVLNAIRANVKPSESFTHQQLTIFSMFNRLYEMHGDDLIYLTKSNMAADKFHYLPEQRPDAFLYLISKHRYYFLYVLNSSTPVFAHTRRIASLFEYESSGKWAVATKANFPKILIVTDTKRLATQLRKQLNRLGQRRGSTINIVVSQQVHFIDPLE